MTNGGYDRSGRRTLTVNPQAPHVLAKHDHQGRLVATGLYSASGSLTSTSDPTSVSTNRVGLSETAYDERGQVWKSIR